MDKLQYDTMSMIMEKGRKFLDEIFHMMQDHGLTEQGYEVELRIDETGGIKDSLKCNYLLSVDINKDIRSVSRDEYHRTAMGQWNKDGKGWVIMHDPRREIGTVPEDKDLSDLPFTDIGGQETDDPATGETAKDAGRSGNGSLWFRDDDGDIPMVCRGDLNGMAESDPGV